MSVPLHANRPPAQSHLLVMTRSGMRTYFGQASFKDAAPSAISPLHPDGTIETPTSDTEYPVGPLVF
jgi:hypothetical protein